MAKTLPGDPAYWMLFDGFTTTPAVHRKGCYICEDPEFARMGLPLCRKCPECGGHIAADDYVCDACGLADGFLENKGYSEDDPLLRGAIRAAIERVGR
jgi:hypothetical protein